MGCGGGGGGCSAPEQAAVYTARPMCVKCKVRSNTFCNRICFDNAQTESARIATRGGGLCQDCFTTGVQHRFKMTLRQQANTQRHHRLLVAFSGGHASRYVAGLLPLLPACTDRGLQRTASPGRTGIYRRRPQPNVFATRSLLFRRL